MRKTGAGTRELRAFIRDNDKLPKDVRRDLRIGLRAAAQKPLLAAKENAAWSTRIPGAIRLSVSISARSAGVAIKVNKKIAPHGRPLEHKGRLGDFRHPVYGQGPRESWTWAENRARPFLWPAAEPWLKGTDEDIGKVVDKVARDHKYVREGT